MEKKNFFAQKSVWSRWCANYASSRIVNIFAIIGSIRKKEFHWCREDQYNDTQINDIEDVEIQYKSKGCINLRAASICVIKTLR
jgi:hypothetical protein